TWQGDNLKLIVEQEKTLFLFDAQARYHRLSVFVPRLIKRLPNDARFFLGLQGDFHQTPRLVVNHQEAAIVTGPLGEKFSCGITQMAASDRYLNRKDLHRPGTHDQFTLARDTEVPGASGIAELQFEMVLGFGIGAHKNKTAFAACPF